MLFIIKQTSFNGPRMRSKVRGIPPPTNVVADIGRYFHFVNRDKSLLDLWKHIKQHVEATVSALDCSTLRLDRLPDKEESRLPGREFILLLGASGIGKSTMVTDGLKKLIAVVLQMTH
jgi:hypothetical protein